MAAIFLSASIPVIGRGQYYETADPFLIQCAVRELTIATVRRHKIVWGGHPAITPMIWSICEDLGVDYTNSVILYQSRFFEGRYPEENQRFDNVVYTDPVPGDIQGSLQLMREQMLSRKDLIGAVFIGGWMVLRSNTTFLGGSILGHSSFQLPRCAVRRLILHGIMVISAGESLKI